MRCQACDAELTEFETTIKSINTGEFLDLCSVCRATIIEDLDTTENYDLYDPDTDSVEFPNDPWSGDEQNKSNTDDDGEI